MELTGSARIGGSNRRFQFKFNKRGQLFIRTHNNAFRWTRCAGAIPGVLLFWTALTFRLCSREHEGTIIPFLGAVIA
jgi:hypothetical protein